MKYFWCMTRNIRRMPAIGCWALLLLGQALSLRAQVVQPPLRHFTVHDGLAQQQVTCMFQDSRGYIWVGTKAGISKFNGRTFENFRLGDDTPSLRSRAFAEDQSGNIWTVTDGGYGWYDGVQWRYRPEASLSELIIFGNLVLGSHSMSPFVWQLGADSAQVILRKDTLRLTKGDEPILYFTHYANPGRNIISGLDKNLRLVVRDTIFYDKHFLTDARNRMAGGAFKITLPDSRGWSYMSDPISKSVVDSIHFETSFKKNADLKCLSTTDHTNYYYSYGNNKIYQTQPGSKNARELNLPISTPSFMIRDREGAIWFGAEDGLYQYVPDGFHAIPATLAPMPWSLVEDNAGAFYIGSYGYGLKRFFRNQLQPVDLPSSIFPCPEHDLFYFGASRDRYGSLYFPHSCGLIQKKGNVFRNVLRIPSTSPAITLYSFYDPDRNQVVAGSKGRVYTYDPAQERLDSIVFQASEGHILCMTKDRQGWYWFSPVWKGIVRYNPESGNIVYFNPENKELPFREVNCMEPDTKNGVWFGSNNGLYFRNDDKQDIIKVADHAIQGPVYTLKTADSLLMIGDLSGLYVLNLNAWRRDRSDRVKAYNQFNGFTGIDPMLGSGMLDSKGNYWVVCSNQIAFLHKSKISLSDYPTRVRIFQINRQRVPYSGATGIVLPEGENEVTVRFESIGFQRPLQTQYSWRLMGYSDDWSDWSGDNLAFFSQLPSGRYTFEVRSRHPGSISEADVETDRYAFEVSLPLYREPHFYRYALFAGSILLLLGFFGLGAWRKARREAQKAREMAVERERLIKYYQVQTLQAQLNPHFIFNLLETIQHFVEAEKTTDAVQQIQRLAILLRRFMESSINSDLDKIREGNREISLAAEIELLTYYIELEQIQKPGMFTFDIAVDDKLEPGNCFITPMIIQPFVENAIKRGLIPKTGPPRHLSIRLSRLDDGIRCQVEDNGIGRAAAREMQSRSPRKFKPRGVSLVQDRVALLAEMGIPIGIDIGDRPGGGTAVTIDFGITDTTET